MDNLAVNVKNIFLKAFPHKSNAYGRLYYYFIYYYSGKKYKLMEKVEEKIEVLAPKFVIFI